MLFWKITVSDTELLWWRTKWTYSSSDFSLSLTLVGQIWMGSNVVSVSIEPSCLRWANREFATCIIWLSPERPLQSSHLFDMMEILSCYLEMLTHWLHFHFSTVVSVFEPGPRACVMAPVWCVLTGRFDAVTHKPSAWGKRLCLLRCVHFSFPSLQGGHPLLFCPPVPPSPTEHIPQLSDK